MCVGFLCEGFKVIHSSTLDVVFQDTPWYSSPKVTVVSMLFAILEKKNLQKKFHNRIKPN